MSESLEFAESYNYDTVKTGISLPVTEVRTVCRKRTVKLNVSSLLQTFNKFIFNHPLAADGSDTSQFFNLRELF